MGISTKRGDGGLSETCGGERLPKDHPVFEALGTLDELGSCLGLLKAVLRRESIDGSGRSSRPLVEQVEEIQSHLIGIGQEVAQGNRPARSSRGSRIGEAELVRLEAWAAALEETLAPRRGFVLPGQTLPSGWADLARTVCRRLERRYVALRRSAARGESTVPAYLNRLSDYLFLLARAWEAGSYPGVVTGDNDHV